MSKLMTNHEIISDKTKNPVTSTDYIKHGDKWLGAALTEVAAVLNSKTDKSYVDTELAKKANTTEVNASLAEKATKTELESTNAAVSSNTSGIADLNTDVNALSARMDTFTNLPEGSTTGDAELADGRVGANGKTYANIGGAIRGQVTDLKEDLTNYYYNRADMTNKHTSKQWSVSGTKVVESGHPSFITIPKFKVKAGEKLTCSRFSSGNCYLAKEDGTVITKLNQHPSYEELGNNIVAFTPDVDCYAYISYNVNTDSTYAMIVNGELPEKYYPFNVVYKQTYRDVAVYSKKDDGEYYNLADMESRIQSKQWSVNENKVVLANHSSFLTIPRIKVYGGHRLICSRFSSGNCYLAKEDGTVITKLNQHPSYEELGNNIVAFTPDVDCYAYISYNVNTDSTYAMIVEGDLPRKFYPFNIVYKKIENGITIINLDKEYKSYYNMVNVKDVTPRKAWNPNPDSSIIELADYPACNAAPRIKLRAGVKIFCNRFSSSWCFLGKEDGTLITKLNEHPSYEDLGGNREVAFVPDVDCYLYISYNSGIANFDTAMVVEEFLPKKYYPYGVVFKEYYRDIVVIDLDKDNKNDAEEEFEFMHQNNLLPYKADYSTPYICFTKSSSGFDNGFIESPNVFWDSNKLKYGMVYTGYYNDGNHERAYGAVGIAWSDDLETWTKSENPIFERNNIPGQCDSGSITGPVMYIENGTYYLFYIGCDTPGYEAGNKTICMATSTDLINWTRCPSNPLISGGGNNWYGTAPYHANVFRAKGVYYMFFNAKPSGSVVENIGFATSTDLVNWVPSTDVVLTHGSSGGVDEKIVGDPYLYDIGDDNIYMMYFCANYASDTYDCLARTSKKDFPYGWKRVSTPISQKGYAKPSIIFRNGKMYHFFGSSSVGIGYYKSN